MTAGIMYISIYETHDVLQSLESVFESTPSPLLEEKGVLLLLLLQPEEHIWQVHQAMKAFIRIDNWLLWHTIHGNVKQKLRFPQIKSSATLLDTVTLVQMQ